MRNTLRHTKTFLLIALLPPTLQAQQPLFNDSEGRSIESNPAWTTSS
jgi:hypothetical protein